MSEDDSTQDSAHKYLIYQLGNELFATPLIEVREVIEFRQAKPVPHTSPFFKGVINIRGEIVGVLDLRERLKIEGSANPTAELIFETDNGPLAAIVDRVHSVSVLHEDDLERKPVVHAQGTDRAYFMGVGKVDDRILTLISLRRIVSYDQPVVTE